MKTVQVKLSYEKVIEDALADEAIKERLLALIQEGNHQEDAALQLK